MLYVIIGIILFLLGYTTAALMASSGLDTRIEERVEMFRKRYEQKIEEYEQMFELYDRNIKRLENYYRKSTDFPKDSLPDFTKMVDWYVGKNPIENNKMITAMAKYIGQEVESCPNDKHGFIEIGCDNICGTKGRRPEDDFWRCWIAYFRQNIKRKDNVMYIEFDDNHNEYGDEMKISAVFSKVEFYSAFKPEDILKIARHQVALRIADEITKQIAPLLKQAIKNCNWNTAQQYEGKEIEVEIK